MENAQVTSLVIENDRVCGATVRINDREESFRAPVTIDATGRTRALARKLERAENGLTPSRPTRLASHHAMAARCSTAPPCKSRRQSRKSAGETVSRCSTNRGDVVIVNGKIFPAETLPSGSGTNDPTQPVNGVAPIGEWANRGQNSFPLPPAVASAYSSTPAAFGTQYFILNDGRALTTEGFLFPSGLVLSSVTGGIGGFRGAAGFSQGNILGTNATGCPNARVKFHIQPGSVRGESNN